MRRPGLYMLPPLVVLSMALGFLGLTTSPAAAQSVGCGSGDDAIVLRLFDNPKDGVLTVNEIEALALTFSEGSQTRADLLDIVARARAQGLVEIRYDGTGPCAAPTATTAAPTATRVPPTATATRIAPTATRVPPTATATRVPPTATATRVPPTATATRVPPTATATRVPSTVTATTAPATATNTPIATGTATRVPATATTAAPTATGTLTATATNTATAIATSTATATATMAPPTPTGTASATATATVTQTPGTSFGTVSNTGGDNLRCRTAPVDGAVIASLPPGTRVELRGPVSNGWYPVRCANQNGFVSAQYLTVSGGPTPTATPGTTFGTVTNTGGDNLRCRTAPVSGAIITSLAPGTRVEVRGSLSNGWYPVRCAGQNGWVSAQYLTVSAGPTPTATPATPTATATTPPTSTPPVTPTPTPGTTFGTVSNTGGDNLRCRTAPVNGTVITLLAPGTRVELRGPVSNGWYPVRCANQNGFVSAQYLTVGGSNPGPGPGPTVGYIDTAGMARANCRTQPSLSGAIITAVPYGSQVTIRGATSNGWTPVRCANQNGWISSQLISSQPPGSSGLGPVDRVVRVSDVTRTRRRSRAVLGGRRRLARMPVPVVRRSRPRRRVLE